MEFLNREVFTLGSFKVTPLILIIAAVVVYVVVLKR